MKLILNSINGEYLRSITELADEETDYVDAAVAYASEASLLFDWCWDNNILLHYWGRFDDSVPVTVPILKTFLERRSPNFTCKLIRHFHSKVIWWRGYGAYIGSANLSHAAWYNNIEAGVFLTDAELIGSGHDVMLNQFFAEVDRHASPLTDELFRAIEQRNRILNEIRLKDLNASEAFKKLLYVQPFEGLTTVSSRSATDARKQVFLKEWNSTLTILRNLAVRVSKDENRPKWIPPQIPQGAQADQFLHAHYYARTFEGRQAKFQEYFERNRGNPDLAEHEAIDWWRKLEMPPHNELRMLEEWGPFLREKLSKENVLKLSEQDLMEICSRVYSMRDHARRVSNLTLGLLPDHSYSMEEKSEALAKYLWCGHSGNGANIVQLIYWVLYGGPRDAVPERLWDATTDPNLRIEHFGISALGEMIGWALPDVFPPRNGRTSKSLRSLGHNVTVHA